MTSGERREASAEEECSITGGGGGGRGETDGGLTDISTQTNWRENEEEERKINVDINREKLILTTEKQTSTPPVGDQSGDRFSTNQ